MDDIYRIQRSLLYLFPALFLSLFPLQASAFGIDLLGEATKPLIAPAQEKLKSLVVYVWIQPYAGYGSGDSDQKRVAAGGAVTSATGLGLSGFLWGGRGGFILAQSVRVGLDYSVQSLKRDTLVETSTAGKYVRQSVNGSNTMLGAMVGVDVPYTPLQAHYTKYFRATSRGDEASGGDGWGAGVNLVIKNPFVLSLEMRKFNFSTTPDTLTGKKAEASYSQYYANLVLMLL